jgi:hypothetical protein
MISDLDIWRAAKLVIQSEGVEAEAHAALMAARFASWGDPDGESLWLRIRTAIRQLEAGPSGIPN